MKVKAIAELSVFGIGVGLIGVGTGCLLVGGASYSVSLLGKVLLGGASGSLLAGTALCAAVVVERNFSRRRSLQPMLSDEISDEDITWQDMQRAWYNIKERPNTLFPVTNKDTSIFALLPDEILGHLLSFITPKELATVSLVSKRFFNSIYHPQGAVFQYIQNRAKIRLPNFIDKLFELEEVKEIYLDKAEGKSLFEYDSRTGLEGLAPWFQLFEKEKTPLIKGVFLNHVFYAIRYLYQESGRQGEGLIIFQSFSLDKVEIIVWKKGGKQPFRSLDLKYITPAHLNWVKKLLANSEECGFLREKQPRKWEELEERPLTEGRFTLWLPSDKTQEASEADLSGDAKSDIV